MFHIVQSLRGARVSWYWLHIEGSSADKVYLNIDIQNEPVLRNTIYWEVDEFITYLCYFYVYKIEQTKWLTFVSTDENV